MNLIQRVQDILLKPKDTWPVIEQEQTDTATLYSGYIAILAAIPALCGFIHGSLIGGGMFGFSYRVPIVSGLVHMVVSYVLSLVMVFVLAFIADTLAPTFGGSKSQINALKLVAYAMTASMVGGVFTLLGGMGALLGVVAGFYGIYLLYLGIPTMMKAPQEKAAGYTAVIVIVAIVSFIIMGSIAALVLPGGMGMGSGRFGGGGFGNHADGGSISIKTPGGEINIDAGKMEEAAKRMEAANKQMEAAQKSGDPAATQKALGDVMGAMAGGTVNGTPIAAAELKGFLPEALGELKRESFETQGGSAMGIATSTANAVYAAGDKRVHLTLSDLGGLGGLAAMGWANMTVDRETQDKVEKVYKDGARSIHEDYRKDGSSGEYTVILANAVIVEARGDHVDMATLKKVAQGIDLGKLESMKRAPK